MFKALFKAGGGTAQAQGARRGRLEDLVGHERGGEDLPLAAIHAKFDAMAQNRPVDNSHLPALVKITRPANHG